MSNTSGFSKLSMIPFRMASFAIVYVTSNDANAPVLYVFNRRASNSGVGPLNRSLFALDSTECAYARPSNANSLKFVQYRSLVASSYGNM